MGADAIDVVIVNFNSTDWVLRCLDSFRTALSRGDVRVLIQDNCSSDSAERLKEHFPAVSVTRNTRNIGFARAVNKALRESASAYAVLMNPDTVVLDGFFSAALGYMEMNPKVGILGPRILNSDGTVQGSARAFPTSLTGLFGVSSPVTKLLPNNTISRANILTRVNDGESPIEVDWVSGACMVVRREALDEVGFLDSRFFMYWEDADWCWRMWAKGWKVVYFPTSKVIHHGGASSSKNRFRSLCAFHKSAFKLFNKHGGTAFRLLSPFVAFGLALRFGLVAVLSAFSARNNKTRESPQR